MYGSKIIRTLACSEKINILKSELAIRWKQVKNFYLSLMFIPDQTKPKHKKQNKAKQSKNKISIHLEFQKRSQLF